MFEPAKHLTYLGCLCRLIHNYYPNYVMYRNFLKSLMLFACIALAGSQVRAQQTQVTLTVKDLKPEARIDLGEGLGEVKFRKLDCTSKGLPITYIEITYLGTQKDGVNLELTALSNGATDTRVLLENTQWNIPFNSKSENWNCSAQTMAARRLILLNETGSAPFFDALVFSVK